jgi:GNAT superfamily N-acetyltransferase
MLEARDATGRPFRKRSYQLMEGAGAGLSLEPIAGAAVGEMAAAISQIDPWRALHVDPARLTTYFTEADEHSCRWLIRAQGEGAGVVGIRDPWLYGPYLAMLAILPGYQHAGIGAAILQWIEREAGSNARNVWACVSRFNSRAGSFYERHGYVEVGVLDDLLREGYAERLMRKRLR